MHIRNGWTLLSTLFVALPVCPAQSRAAVGDDDFKCPVGSFAVLNKRAVEKPEPEYPEEARRLGIEGVVAVFVLVDEQGRVIKARACTGPRELHRAAEDAACRARLRPTMLSGAAVKNRGMLTYAFRQGVRAVRRVHRRSGRGVYPDVVQPARRLGRSPRDGPMPGFSVPCRRT